MKKIMTTIILLGILGFAACVPTNKNHAAKKPGQGEDGPAAAGVAAEKMINTQGMEQRLKSTANEGAISRDSEFYSFYQIFHQMGNVFNESWTVAKSVENDRGTDSGKQNPFNKAEDLLIQSYNRIKAEETDAAKSTDKTAADKSTDKVADKATRKSYCDVPTLAGKVDAFVNDSGSGDKVLLLGKCDVDPDPKVKDPKKLVLVKFIEVALKTSGDFNIKIYSTDFYNRKSNTIHMDPLFNYGLGSVIDLCSIGGSEACQKIRAKINCSGNFDGTQYSLNKMDCQNLVKEYNNSSSFVFNSLTYSATDNDIWNFVGNRLQVVGTDGIPVAVQEIKLKAALHAGDKEIPLLITQLVDPNKDQSAIDKSAKDKKNADGVKPADGTDSTDGSGNPGGSARGTETPIKPRGTGGAGSASADSAQEDGTEVVPANPDVVAPDTQGAETNGTGDSQGSKTSTKGDSAANDSSAGVADAAVGVNDSTTTSTTTAAKTAAERGREQRKQARQAAQGN